IIDQVKEVRHRTEETVLPLLRREAGEARSEEQLRADARRILGKLEKLDQHYVRWWEALLTVLAGWGGYAAPVGLRLFQRRMRHMEMKHEVDQLHAVISILDSRQLITRRGVLHPNRCRSPFASPTARPHAISV